MSRYDLNGKVALVTGGARGLGEATAHALARRGATVAIADLERDTVDAAAATIAGRAMGIRADVTDSASMHDAVGEVVEWAGRLDVVIANAGVNSRAATLRAMSADTARRLLDVNVHGALNTVQAVLPQVIANHGHIVLVSSVFAYLNGAGAVPYAMSKAAVEQLGRGLRVELAQHGASVTTAYFALINTALVRQSVDSDADVLGMLAAMPRPLLKRIEAAAAGESIAAAVQRRSARLMRPRRWTAMSMLRGISAPLLDAAMERDARTQGPLRNLDRRAGEDQPTTA